MSTYLISADDDIVLIQGHHHLLNDLAHKVTIIMGLLCGKKAQQP
jgi:hypothetical protein